MAIFGQWPWTNFHEMNLDWVIKTTKEAVANIQQTVIDYFTAHVDNTLTVSGDAADAATVGSRLTTVNGSISALDGRIDTLEEHALKKKYVPIIYDNGTYSYGTGTSYADAFAIVNAMLIEPGGGGGEQYSDTFGVIYYREKNIVNPQPAYMMTSCYYEPSMSDAKIHISFSDGLTTLILHSDGTIS